jgi:hypothetical protein
LMFDSNPKSQAAENEEPQPGGPPLVFQTVVRLVLADRSQPDSSGGSSTGPAFPGT